MSTNARYPFRNALRLLAMAAGMLPFLMLAQGSIEVDGTVRDKDSNRKIAGVEISVLRGGQAYDAVSTLSNGRYTLSLDHGADYVLLFTFEDMSPRKVLLNTSSIPEAFQERPFYLTVEMSLFDVPSGFDRDLLEEPIGKVAFDAAKEQLAWDLPYTSSMQARIEDELESSAGGGDEEASNREYEEHMRKAEVEFGRERWAQSINWLERALTEVPGDSRAEEMMADAQERMAQAESEAEVRREYEQLMREGKMAMRKEDWGAARAAIQSASDLLPGEQEPRDLLAELDAADAASDTSDEDAAYDAAVNSGLAAMEANDLGGAEAAFEEASGIRPSERLPREKLTEIRQLRKAEERDAASAERLQQEYQTLIDRADRSFDDQDYVRAKSLYEQASGIMPGEAYPRERALEAEGRIVELALEEEETATRDSRDGQGGIDREYEDRIREGDQAFDGERWQEARAAYEAASALKPDERYPKNRLRRIEALSGGDSELDTNLEVDREALLAEQEAEAAASEAESAAIMEEQARLLEEERLAALEEEERNRSANQSRLDADLDRSRNYVSAMQNAEQDAAESYYRDALESEIRARGQAVYAKADRQSELNDIWSGNSDGRRQSAYNVIREKGEERENATYEAASYRQDRMADLEVQTTRYSENEQDWKSTGDAGRRDRFITLTRKERDNRERLQDRTRRYKVFADSLDRMLKVYADFNRDLRLASVDDRIMRFEDIERRAAQHQRVGEGSEMRRLDRWSDVQREEREHSQSNQLAAGEAEIRSASALRKVMDKDMGEPPTSEDFQDVPAKEGIRQGMEERSYEEGNALIIERIVRQDNEVNVYRKTVAKHGVYYFKNDRSITREIWVLETFTLSD